MSADTNGSQAQQSDNIQQDLYRLLHSNNSGKINCEIVLSKTGGFG